jgi:hypothetical protein
MISGFGCEYMIDHFFDQRESVIGRSELGATVVTHHGDEYFFNE